MRHVAVLPREKARDCWQGESVTCKMPETCALGPMVATEVERSQYFGMEKANTSLWYVFHLSADGKKSTSQRRLPFIREVSRMLNADGTTIILRLWLGGHEGVTFAGATCLQRRGTWIPGLWTIQSSERNAPATDKTPNTTGNNSTSPSMMSGDITGMYQTCNERTMKHPSQV
jgi:hypothetical protein